MRTLCILTTTLLLAGCHGIPAADTPAESTPITGDNDTMFTALTQLAGDWKMTDDEGKDHFFRFDVTSGGHCVREIMFPGDAHEMTNFYHMDGDKLAVTHFCAAGNQPRMVATEARKTPEGTVYAFDFERVSNLREEHQYYMGNMTLTILENGQLQQDWRSYDREGNLTDPMTFLLSRTDGAKPMKAGFKK